MLCSQWPAALQSRSSAVASTALPCLPECIPNRSSDRPCPSLLRSVADTRSPTGASQQLAGKLWLFRRAFDMLHDFQTQVETLTSGLTGWGCQNGVLVDVTGIEPATSSLRTTRSPS